MGVHVVKDKCPLLSYMLIDAKTPIVWGDAPPTPSCPLFVLALRTLVCVYPTLACCHSLSLNCIVVPS